MHESMIFLTIMSETNQDWSQSTTILGIVLAVLIAVMKWISESFKNRREERESVIKIAVREAMSDIKKDIEDARRESSDGLKHVHQRIDDVMKEIKK